MSETTNISGTTSAASPMTVPAKEVTDSQPLVPPATFRELALRVANAFYEDIHVKGSGLVFFTLLGYGVLHPAAKDQCEALAALAATYLFGVSLNRK